MAAKKCPNCGLVNSPEVKDCKRCSASLSQVIVDSNIQPLLERPINNPISNHQTQKRYFDISKGQLALVAGVSVLFFLGFLISIVKYSRENKIKVSQIESNKLSTKVKKLSEVKAINIDLASLLDEYVKTKNNAEVDKKYKGKVVNISGRFESFNKKDGKPYIYLTRKANTKIESDPVTGRNVEVSQPFDFIEAVFYIDNSCMNSNLYMFVSESEKIGFTDLTGIFVGNLSNEKEIPQIVISSAIFRYSGKWSCDSDIAVE